MPCAEHLWWFSVPCPKCEAAAAAAPAPVPVTAAVSEKSAPDVPISEKSAPDVPISEKSAPDVPISEKSAPDVPINVFEGEATPDFLKRNPDNSFACPNTALASIGQVAAEPALVAAEQRVGRDLHQWSDEQLHRANSDETISIVDRQPILRELHRRYDRRKALDRIAKMKEKATSKPE